MQNWVLVIILVIIFGSPIQLKAQYTEEDTIQHKFFIGSTFFVL